MLGMDLSVNPALGEQKMCVWSGHCACNFYHPLIVFKLFGELKRCALCPGNVHSVNGCKDVLKSVVKRYRGKVSRIGFRVDAAFANPEIFK